jgi:hypothetical protein
VRTATPINNPEIQAHHSRSFVLIVFVSRLPRPLRYLRRAVRIVP